MVLCYDLSLRSEISTILFGFSLLPLVFYGNMCVYETTTCPVYASLTRKSQYCLTHAKMACTRWEGKGMRLNGLPTTVYKLVQRKLDT